MSESSNKDKISSMVFLHIPKAGGSTLRTIICQQYKPDTIFTIDERRVRESMEEFRNLPEEKRAKFKVVMGHMTFGLHEFMTQPCTYITVLRDPVERVLSTYYYVLRTPRHRLHEKVSADGMDLEQFVRLPISMLNNGQTRLLSGNDVDHDPDESALEKAKRNLQEFFSVVGILEQFEETLVLVKRTFGWDMPYYYKKNVTRNRPICDDIPHDTVKIVEKNNELDIRLYEYAKSLFKDQMNLQGADFYRELKTMRLINNTTPVGRLVSFYRRGVSKYRKITRQENRTRLNDNVFKR